ncbi:hypothetical protein GCM10007111_42500 [Virgibacillus kapii]|uniref:Group-specific protein n=1 Tax=Virgibacillus kapii TaxID=1638645 RepID=A0ABQ2DWT4_9BACI|nr:hypothetical protein GCM10007111_42500 [Virgibacillus kapii]
MDRDNITSKEGVLRSAHKILDNLEGKCLDKEEDLHTYIHTLYSQGFIQEEEVRVIRNRYSNLKNKNMTG